MHVPRLRTVRPLLALAALVAAFAFGPSGTASAAAAPIQLGAYVPDGPEDGNALDAYAAMVGQKPDIVMKYSNPTDPLLTSAEISNLESRGETPMVTWQLLQVGLEWSHDPAVEHRRGQLRQLSAPRRRPRQGPPLRRHDPVRA